MYKGVVVLCVFIACSSGAPASGDDPGFALEQVSGQASTATETNRHKRDEATTEKDGEECTKNGVKGICVKYYLCDDKTGVEDFSKLIDIHKRSVDGEEECQSYLDTCCRPAI